MGHVSRRAHCMGIDVRQTRQHHGKRRMRISSSVRQARWRSKLKTTANRPSRIEHQAVVGRHGQADRLRPGDIPIRRREGRMSRKGWHKPRTGVSQGQWCLIHTPNQPWRACASKTGDLRSRTPVEIGM